MKKQTQIKLRKLIERVIREESDPNIKKIESILSDYDVGVSRLEGKIHVFVHRNDFDEFKKYSDMVEIRKLLQQNRFHKIVWTNRNAKNDSGISLMIEPKP